jgi:UDP-glucose 4-epimerase
MNVFVTGGMGFIGSYLVMELLKNGHQVSILARVPEKVPPFQTMPDITIVQGGLTDLEVIAKHLPGHDACIHNALYWGNTATDMLKNDTVSSVQVFEAAAAAGIQHLIYTSSTAAMGNFVPNMHEEMKPNPTDFYGATKAATEAYLLAFASRTSMRCNIVRPGYTFGNPVVEGAPIEIDSRIRDIVQNALTGADIHLTRNDGTQFIWAADLARIYTAVLHSNMNRSIYFGLGQNFTSWEAVARQAIEITASKSQIVLEDKGYSDEPILCDVSKIEREFALAFDSSEKMTEHLQFLAQELKG